MRRTVLFAALLSALALSAVVLWQWPAAEDTGPARTAAAPATTSCQRDRPMLVAPIFHGTDMRTADTPLRARPRDPADVPRMLNARLDAMQPRDRARSIALGYTLTIPILSLFEPATDGNWQFAPRALQAYLALIEQVDRPVVVYLLSDHFSPDSALTRSLMQDPRNLMAKPDGAPPISRYFTSVIAPFTLSIDEQVPVNRLRFDGLRQAARALHALDQRLPGRIQAITLGGEFHHLFDGLQENTGKFTDIDYTDYSPLAQREFRAWLQQRHGSVQDMNRALGTGFAGWDQVRAPGGNIRKGPLEGFWQHMDADAGGRLPIFGWIDVDAGVQAIHVELNGRRIGQAELGFNRLDVYQARAEIRNPNTGFRYDLDVQPLAPGVHRMRLVAQMRDGTQQLVATRQIARMATDQSLPELPMTVRLLRWLRPEASLPAFDANRFWLDSPREMQDVYVNPFAVAWQGFREDQVRMHIRKLFEIATEQGLEPKRLFSHQLLPHFNGGWNDTLFAANRSFDGAPFQPGITLYGGLTVGPLALTSTAGRPYGVPELNPLLGKDPAEPEQALEFALAHCARFVSPMFMNLSDSEPAAADAQSLFLIAPNSPHAHGRNFYAAIERFVRR